MKRFVMLLAMLLLLAGCGGGSDAPAEAGDDNVVEIRDQFFVMQVEHIFMNSNEFLGRTIQFEGVFVTAAWDEFEYHFVLRYKMDCCGPGGDSVGFMVDLDGAPQPAANAWVGVSGVLEEYEMQGHTSLRLNVLSIEEMEERGAEFVMN